MSNQLVQTICMQTKDAVRSTEGEFTMNLTSDASKLSAVKVALGSLEFPIVQWTIEKEWANLHYFEGFRPGALDAQLELQEELDGDTAQRTIRLPLYLNEIVAVLNAKPCIRIVCKHPHGLWAEDGTSVLPCFRWCEVEIICGPMGRVSLSSLHALNHLHPVSETEFDILAPVDSLKLPISSCCGYVHVPTYPSLGLLCETLTFAVAHATAHARYSVDYDPVLNKASFVVRWYPETAKRFRVRLLRTALAQYLGYNALVHEKHFERPGTPGLFHTGFESAVLPFRLPSDVCAAPWSHVRITPGWYAPSHRPFCTGQPLRFSQELETALNRFYFPLSDRVPPNHCTGHFMVFTDPAGVLHMCPIISGKYDVHAICGHLERYMTRLAAQSIPGVCFTVRYDNERIQFSCEVHEGGVVVPATFGLNFDHPAQFDPSRIGFSAIPFFGAHTYSSDAEVVVPAVAPKNIYRMTEIAHQKTLRFCSASIPPLTCILTEYNPDTSIVVMQTYVGQLPFAHGLQQGDVVQIGRCQETELLYLNEDQEWAPRTFEPCMVAPRWGRSGVVVRLTEDLPSHMVCVIVTKAPPLRSELHKIVQMQICVQPCNFCFGTLAKSIPPHMVGFPEGAVQWGYNGTTRTSRGISVPPFDAPFVHALDHPDYVLLFLAEATKQGTLLQHANGQRVTTPFAKIVLYPMMREERMLPRDTMMNSQAMTQFTMRFENPDGTPYHFHGAQFSFSLNFVIA